MREQLYFGFNMVALLLGAQLDLLDDLGDEK
jgi:hypothetical protein